MISGQLDIHVQEMKLDAYLIIQQWLKSEQTQNKNLPVIDETLLGKNKTIFATWVMLLKDGL